jgi:Na+-translocating ferredoxin:NAD+ oxidoreductase RnfC subunit
MSVTLQQLEQAEPPEIVTTLRNAGLAGAGGAGFPTHAKWDRLDDVPFLMVNHQESEPNYYIDKWLGQSRAAEYASFFDALLERTFEVIVVCAKEKHRERWMGDLEAATDATIYLPDDLPIDPVEESGVVFAYTDDKYQYGMESVLLRIVADIAMRDELPMDHGWIVQNTETLYDVYLTLDAGEPVTRKYVHVDGNVPHHRFLEVPVGTPASVLLEAAGRPPSDLGEDEVLLDGGPGWCFEIDESPEGFGVTKRTNCVLALDRDVVEENTLGDERVNCMGPLDWSGDHETEPSTLEPERVRVPLLTNPGFGNVLARSQPIVEEGSDVARGEMIAVPGEDGISNTQHASIDGTVAAVTDTHVEIHGESESVDVEGRELDHDRMVYWTWCEVCGAYVARPEWDHLGEGTSYVCQDCR